MDTTWKEQTLENIAQAFVERYVYAERGAALARHLREWGQEVPLPDDLPNYAAAVTTEIQRHTPDRHIRVVENSPATRPSRPATVAGIRKVQVLDSNIGLLEIHGFLSDAAPSLDAAMSLLANASALEQLA